MRVKNIKGHTSMTGQGLAKGVHSNEHAILYTKFLDYSSTLRSEYTSCVRLVDIEISIPGGEQVIHNLNKLLNGSHITIHAVYRFNNHEDITAAVSNRWIRSYLGLEHLSQPRWRTVREHFPSPRPGETHSLVGTGMNELVIQNHIPGLGNTG